MVKLTNLAKVINANKTTRLIWYRNKQFDLISDGVFVVKIYKNEWPKSLINKIEKKFGDKKPKNGQWLMSCNDNICENNMMEMLNRFIKNVDIHEIINTNLIQHMPRFKVRGDDLYARILQSNSGLIFIDEELFNIVDCKNYKIFGSSDIEPVFISKSNVEDWEIIIMPLRMSGEISGWVNNNIDYETIKTE